jgi:hypothetical protein
MIQDRNLYVNICDRMPCLDRIINLVLCTFLLSLIYWKGMQGNDAGGSPR